MPLKTNAWALLLGCALLSPPVTAPATDLVLLPPQPRADMTIGLRVDSDAERQGLDLSSHGESAYHG